MQVSDPIAFEKEHVCDVYEEIAPHFSDTRHSPWPVVSRFLSSEVGEYSMGIDIGCGNGKYLGLNPKLNIIGCDVSRNLLGICRQRGYHTVQCDATKVPFKTGFFDFCISIAVIHHFASHQRRLEAVKECLRVTRAGGQVLLFVWAFEQEKLKYTEQDVFVRWKLAKKYNNNEENEPQEEKVLQRYYHLFKKGELEQLVLESGMGHIKVSGYDRDNWYVLVEKTSQ